MRIIRFLKTKILNLFKATNKNNYRENEARKNKKSEKGKNIEFDEDANAVDL